MKIRTSEILTPLACKVVVAIEDFTQTLYNFGVSLLIYSHNFFKLLEVEIQKKIFFCHLRSTLTFTALCAEMLAY